MLIDRYLPHYKIKTLVNSVVIMTSRVLFELQTFKQGAMGLEETADA
jgi:hypothetical protein